MGQQFGPHFAELMTENLSALSFDMRKLAGLEAIEEMKASFSIPAAITSEISEQIRSQTAAFSALRAMPPVTLTFPTLKAADQVRAFTSSSELVDAFRKAFPTPITVDLPSIEFVENTERASEMARTAAAQEAAVRMEDSARSLTPAQRRVAQDAALNLLVALLSLAAFTEASGNLELAARLLALAAACIAWLRIGGSE